MLRISSIDRVANSRVHERSNKETKLLNIIKQRELEYFGNIIRHSEKYGPLRLIVQGKVLDRRKPERRTTSSLENLSSL